jgi:hypothetical protein
MRLTLDSLIRKYNYFSKTQIGKFFLGAVTKMLTEAEYHENSRQEGVYDVTRKIDTLK